MSPAFFSGRCHHVIRAFIFVRVSLPRVSVTPAGESWPRLTGSSPAQRSVAPSGQCKYLLPAHYPEQGPGAGSALPARSRCAQSPARPWQHRIPPGSASVTAGTTREATASSARGSSPISTHRPRQIPLPGSCPLQTKAGEGRESKRKAREKGAGGGGGGMQAGVEGNGGFLEGDAANGRGCFRAAPGRPPCSGH